MFSKNWLNCLKFSINECNMGWHHRRLPMLLGFPGSLSKLHFGPIFSQWHLHVCQMNSVSTTFSFRRASGGNSELFPLYPITASLPAALPPAPICAQALRHLSSPQPTEHPWQTRTWGRGKHTRRSLFPYEVGDPPAARHFFWLRASSSSLSSISSLQP